MQIEDKKQVVEELRELFRSHESLIIAGYQGLRVNDLNEMRRKLDTAGCSFRVVKNRLAVRSLDALGESEASELSEHFRGPTAILMGASEPSDAIKIFKEYSEDNELMAFKGGIMSGLLLNRQQVNKIAQLPSREVLLAQTASALHAPVQGLYNALAGTVRGLLFALKDYIKKKEEEPSEDKAEKPEPAAAEEEKPSAEPAGEDEKGSAEAESSGEEEEPADDKAEKPESAGSDEEDLKETEPAEDSAEKSEPDAAEEEKPSGEPGEAVSDKKEVDKEPEGSGNKEDDNQEEDQDGAEKK